MQHIILVVDDDPFSRQVIIDILEQSGENFHVLTAENGDEAIKVAIESVPDAIMMDWQMPGISGVDVVKRLKEEETTRDIPVLMVTAVTAPEKLKEAFEAGAVDYITKPAKDVELLVRVKSVLRTTMYYKEVLKQKQEIEEQQKDIAASIRYARDIQAAILPEKGEIKRALPKSFVLFKPKDIVSGDFYWFSRQNGKVFLAACDCTGHGVPGAFVSMVGNDLLNQIIIEKEIFNPGEVLSLLNKGMISVFTRASAEYKSNQDLILQYEHSDDLAFRDWGSQIKDGMDMVLCVFDEKLSKLEFAGAQNPIYYIREGVLTEIKGDRQPIGGRTEINYNFTKHELNLQRGDIIYLFSDGYADQLGGPREKKFMTKNFKQLLLDLNGKNLSEQKKILDRTNIEWRGEMDQIDDILVIGVKI